MTSKLRLTTALTLGVAICAGLFFMAANAQDADFTLFQQHMHSHLERVGAIKAAVIAGDLEAVREPAEWLAEHEKVEVPDTWMRYVDEMQRYAEQAATAKNLVGAAAAVSEIGRACGDCHLASGNNTV